MKSVKDGVSTCAGSGAIEINGKKQPLNFDVNIANKAGQLTVSGLVPIKMTDFPHHAPSPVAHRQHPDRCRGKDLVRLGGSQ